MRMLHGLAGARPGVYYTRDRRFRVERHAASGRAVGGLGYNAWHIFTRDGKADRWFRVRIGGRREWETFRSAAVDLGRQRSIDRAAKRAR